MKTRREEEGVGDRGRNGVREYASHLGRRVDGSGMGTGT